MSIPARARSLDRRFFGVVEGLVSDNVDPDKEGRIKVTFPWFDGGEMVSEWCRVRQLYAGNGYGTFFVPEIGDEVLLAFVHGDMRLPIVLGGLYNGKDKPPSDRQSDSAKNQKLIRTKAGHEILLDDTDSKERVRIKTKGSHSADLSDVDKKIEIKTSGGHKITLDDDGQAITVQTSGGHQLKLDDTGQAVSIQTTGGAVLRMDDAGQDILVTTGGASVILDGAAGSITLAAQTVTVAATTLAVGASTIQLGNGASEPLVLGNSFMALFNAHTHTATSVGAPTTPPISPMTPAVLSSTGKTS